MTDRRAFSRVKARLRACARPLRKADSSAMYRWSAAHVERPTEKELLEGQVPHTLIRFLTALDQKLDMLLALQGQDQIFQEYPYRLEIRDISGGGVIFYSDENFAKGDVLEIVITLCDAPLQTAAAVGRIVECGPEQEYHFVFTNIREHDLERVVQFVFQEEREQIRREKWA